MAMKQIEVCDRCGTAPRAGLRKGVKAALMQTGAMINETEPQDLCGRCVKRAERFIAKAMEKKVTK